MSIPIRSIALVPPTPGDRLAQFRASYPDEVFEESGYAIRAPSFWWRSSHRDGTPCDDLVDPFERMRLAPGDILGDCAHRKACIYQRTRSDATLVRTANV